MQIYSLVAKEIKSVSAQKRQLRFLDVDCGDARFLKALINVGIVADFLTTDLSFNMISNAANNLDGHDVKLFVADAFELPLKDSLKFDVIHIDSVLHRLIGRTRGKSMKLVEKMLRILATKLSNNGLLRRYSLKPFRWQSQFW